MLNIKKTKKIILSAAVLAAVIVPTAMFAVNKINSTDTTFAATMPNGFNDQNFYDCIVGAFRKNYPDENVSSNGLTETQLEKITVVECPGDEKADADKIRSVSGLEKMTGLKVLTLPRNNISSINLSNNSNLMYINVAENQLETLDVSNNLNLDNIVAYGNKLSGTFDASNNTKLEKLSVNNNQLTGLNLGNISSLEELYIYKNNLSGTLDLSKNTELKNLSAYNNNFTGFNMTGLNKLEKLSIGTNNITDTNVVNNIVSVIINNKDHLDTISIEGLLIGTIDPSVFPELTSLNVGGCGLSSLDVSNNAKLKTLRAHENNLSSLDVSHNAELSNLTADNTTIVIAGIEDENLTSGQKTFNLSSLKFISTDGNTTISNTDDYTFDSSSKILNVSNVANTRGFVMTSPIDDTAIYGEYRTYKLQIGKLTSDSPTNDIPDKPTGDQTDSSTDDEDDADGTAVPNTSGGDESSGSNSRSRSGKDIASRPETGALTNNSESNSSTGISVLPIAIVVLTIVGIAGRKYMARRKFNW